MKTITIKARYPWWPTWTIHFCRRWPFIRAHRGFCMCDINAILDEL